MNDDFPNCSCSDCGFDRQGNTLTGYHARFTVISPTLIRMEYSESNSLTDQPTFLVRNREWETVSFDSHVDLGWLVISTDRLTVRYQVGAPFAEDTLRISWNEREWHPGTKDPQNLGGTNWSLDAAGHEDWFPNIFDYDGHDFHTGLLSRMGFAVVDDTRGALWNEETGWVQARPEDPSRRDIYFFYYGTNFRHMLSEFIRLTGPVPMLPRWAFGSWYSRYHPYKDSELKDIVETYREKKIPLDVLVIDMDWHLHGWVGFDWNRECFPDPDGFLKWCKDSNLRVSLNDHTPEVHGKYVFPVEDSHYKPIVERLGLPSGEPVQLNFEDPAHWEAFRDIVLDPFLDSGVDLWWLDYKGTKAEPKPTVNPRTWLAKLFYDETGKRKGERPLTFMRYGDLGGHRYPIGFSGDANSQWNVLDFEVPFTSHAVNVVFPYWSHDIGGFHGMWLDPEMFVRWVQFGAFSPVLRLHSSKDENGQGGHRLPWEYGEESEKIISHFFRLRYSLMPYIYTHSRITHETAVPLCRPMYLDYPDVEECYLPETRGQYMFGESILAAPITEPGGEKTVYLPQGKWYDFFTGETYSGPVTINVKASLDRMPLFVKAGAIIPMQPDVLHTDEKVNDLTIHVYAGADSSFSLYEDDGITLDYQKGGYSRTKLSYSESGGDVKFLIGPANGEYQGQPESRSYQVAFHGLNHPEKIYLNGEVLDENQWKYSDGLVQVNVPEAGIDESVWMVLKGG